MSLMSNILPKLQQRKSISLSLKPIDFQPFDIIITQLQRIISVAPTGDSGHGNRGTRGNHGNLIYNKIQKFRENKLAKSVFTDADDRENFITKLRTAPVIQS